MASILQTAVMIVAMLLPAAQNKRMSAASLDSLLSSDPKKSGVSPEKSSEESVYQPLSRENVRMLLSQAVLRPNLLPKLKYSTKKLTFPIAEKNHENIKLPGQLPILKARPMNRGSLPALGRLFEMPGLMPYGNEELPKKMSLSLPQGSLPQGSLPQGSLPSASEFPLGVPQPPSTWLMSIKDLKSETCKTDVYNRTISSKGCRSTTIQSKFCTGRCNSFFVPSAKADFQSCSSCFPSDFRTVTVILTCPQRRKGYKIKRIQIIRNCKCQSVMECSPLSG